MERSWYHIAKECTALRKNVLRVDLCVFIDKEEALFWCIKENYIDKCKLLIKSGSIINKRRHNSNLVEIFLKKRRSKRMGGLSPLLGMIMRYV